MSKAAALLAREDIQNNGSALARHSLKRTRCAASRDAMRSLLLSITLFHTKATWSCFGVELIGNRCASQTMTPKQHVRMDAGDDA